MKKDAIGKSWWPLFAAVMAFAAFQLFFRLDALPVQNLDEARQGTTAYEMLVSGDYAKTTYLFETDHYNTKPPLLFWIMTLTYRVFGISIFAFRFPSALFGLLTVALTMLVARRRLGPLTALFSGIALSTTYAFVHFHSARKGDFDSLFVFFMTAALALVLESEKRKRLLAWSGLAAGLAFLTKSFAVIQVFAVSALYLFAAGRWKKYSWKDYLGYLALFLVPVLGWAALRYSADGLAFFRSMIGNDMVIRTTRQLGTSSSSVFWYFGVIAAQFFPWSVFLALFFFHKNSWAPAKTSGGGRDFLIRLNAFFREPFFLYWIVVPFALFSVTAVRLDWYILGVYPPLSVLVGWYLKEMSDSARVRYRRFPGAFWPQITVLAIAALFTVASVAVIHIQDRDSEQRVLVEWTERGNRERTVFFVNRGENYGEIFLASVLRGCRIRRVFSVDDYLGEGLPGDVVHLPDQPGYRTLIETKNLGILAVSNGWILAEKK